MSYRVINFDGLATPFLRQSGDEDNMGTGSAQTDFRQVPGGGFYRMRRAKRSPQGIRPVTKSGVLRGASAADLRAQIDAWRAKIGVYGKLVVYFRDGSLRWQWAELQDVDLPVGSTLSNARYQPISLTWQTAAQHWNGVERGTGWVIGDNTFVLGDGTTEVGQDGHRITLTYYPESGSSAESYVFYNALSNMDASASISIDAANEVSQVGYLNRETGQSGEWTGVLAAGESLRFRGSDLSVAKLGVTKSIVDAANFPFPSLNYALVETSAAHGLTDGDSIEITGISGIAGVWHNITVQDATRIEIPTPVYIEIDADSLEGSGTLRKYTDAFAAATINDLARFLTIKPGLNTLTVYTLTAGAGDSALLEYTDAYA